MRFNHEHSSGEEVDANGVGVEWQAVADMAKEDFSSEISEQAETPEPSDLAENIAQEPEAQIEDKKVEMASDILNGFERQRKDFESYGQEISGKTVEQMAPNLVTDELYVKTVINKISSGREGSNGASAVTAKEIMDYCANEISQMEAQFSAMQQEKHGGLAQKRLAEQISTAAKRLERIASTIKKPAENNRAEAVEPEHKVVSGAELADAFAKSHQDFESYATEVSGQTIEERAPDFVADEAYFNDVMAELTRDGGDAASISSDEIIEHYREDYRKNVRRYNELNDEISKKRNSLGFFGRRFGKGARELKAMQKEQDQCWQDSEKMNARIDRLKKMFE